MRLVLSFRFTFVVDSYIVVHVVAWRDRRHCSTYSWRVFPIFLYICRYPAYRFGVDPVSDLPEFQRSEFSCWEHVGFSFIFCTVVISFCILWRLLATCTFLLIIFYICCAWSRLMGLLLYWSSKGINRCIFHFCTFILMHVYISVDVCIYIASCGCCCCWFRPLPRSLEGTDGLVGEHGHFGWGSVKRIHHVRFLNFSDKSK